MIYLTVALLLVSAAPALFLRLASLWVRFPESVLHAIVISLIVLANAAVFGSPHVEFPTPSVPIWGFAVGAAYYGLERMRLARRYGREVATSGGL